MRYPSVPVGFAGLPSCELSAAQCVVLPVPYDMTTSYISGARFGPQALIEASRHVETFDENLGVECSDLRFATLEPIEADSRGPEPMMARVYEAAREAHGEGRFVLGLGGEHSVSYGLLRAAREVFGEIGVLQLDAHLDLRDSFEGSPFNHACLMRRVRDDLGLPIQQVGIRSFSVEEQQYVQAQGLRYLSAQTLMTQPYSQRLALIDAAVEALPAQVYLTVDLDAFDPAYVPATGTPEPGGLDWYTVLAVVDSLAKKRRIVAADLVELAPIGGQVSSDFLAAKLALKIVSRALQGHLSLGR